MSDVERDEVEKQIEASFKESRGQLPDDVNLDGIPSTQERKVFKALVRSGKIKSHFKVISYVERRFEDKTYENPFPVTSTSLPKMVENFKNRLRRYSHKDHIKTAMRQGGFVPRDPVYVIKTSKDGKIVLEVVSGCRRFMAMKELDAEGFDIYSLGVSVFVLHETLAEDEELLELYIRLKNHGQEGLATVFHEKVGGIYLRVPSS
eukprot:g15775.t1